MSVAEILFVVAGLLIGLAFQGGMLLFLIPFAVVAFVLACMNRPRLAGPNSTPSTAPLPVISISGYAVMSPGLLIVVPLVVTVIVCSLIARLIGLQ